MPAIVLTEFICHGFRKERLARLGLILVVNIGAVLLVYLFQFYETGVWFAYGKTIKHWGLELTLLKLPFGTYQIAPAGYWVLQLDALSILIGSLAVICVGKFFLLRLKGISATNQYHEIFVFSALNIAGVCFSRLLFGHVMSMNRYVFASAFLPVFFLLLPNVLSILRNPKKIRMLMGVLMIYWILFLKHGLLKTWLNFIPATVGVGLYLTIVSYRIRFTKWLKILIYLALTIVQVFLFSCFTNGLWVG